MRIYFKITHCVIEMQDVKDSDKKNVETKQNLNKSKKNIYI